MGEGLQSGDGIDQNALIMIRTNTLTLFIVFCCVWQTASRLAMAESLLQLQEPCLSAPLEHEKQLQSMLENWISGASRSSEQEYQQRILELESTAGVFDVSLIPELLGLGISHSEQQSYGDASDALRRALHIVRINEGLYSIEQLPLLELLIESNNLAGDWEEVAKNYDLMYWLYRRNYSDSDPQQLKQLKRIRRWYIESYNKDTGRTLRQLFDESEHIYKRGLAIARNCSDDERQALCFWHRSCCVESEETYGKCPADW